MATLKQTIQVRKRSIHYRLPGSLFTNRNGHRFARFVWIVLALATYGTCIAGAELQQAVPLLAGLGQHSYPISTKNSNAQAYFTQGLILSYGFNHAEAARSFREAARHDPQCAICYWGEALVLGPNINAAMDISAVPKAWSALQQARSLREHGSPVEQALIQALTKRYSEQVVKDRSKLDSAYAEAMRTVSRQFPKDADILALFAEALMNLHPWDYWSKDGKPRPWTPELMQVLQQALQIDSNNPLANHLYIHTMEASTQPELALPSAKRLGWLVPGSGHLVHMPGHIYIRLGRYREVVKANQNAVKIDQDYLRHSHGESIYTMAYVPHNFHFLWAAAIKSGQQAIALNAAQDTAAKVDPAKLREPGINATLQHFWLTPLFTQALFGQWEEILGQSPPAEDLLYPKGIWHYARGLALLRTGKIQQAQDEIKQLRTIMQDPGIKGLSIFEINPVGKILAIAEAILAGEIAAEQKNESFALRHLETAVEIEDSLNYTEPKDWYLPPRQVLGAILLELGKPAKAEQVFRKDLEYHPRNGWSLFGLIQSLKAQRKNAQARDIDKVFSDVWQDADIRLDKARF